ncbi:MAG: M3 family metallopeptidase, partial [Alphaproteobacteria bacterium]|nr:M3 family metallopeptidase [Alphaproteobacteria bacterium]
MAESLPAWDLSCLYSGIDDERIKQDLDAVDAMVAQMNRLYLGKLATLDADQWVQVFGLFEKMGFIEGRIGAFFVNITNTNLDSPQINSWKQGILERLNDIGKEEVAFSLELQKLPRDYVDGILADKRLARYGLVFEKALMKQPHALSEDLEKLDMDVGTVSGAGWSRFNKELTTAHAVFEYRGKKVLLSDLAKLLESADKSERADAGQAQGKVYKEQLWMNSLAYNMYVKGGLISCKWRKYPNYNTARNMSNLLDDGVVDALASAVKTHGYPISREFYKAKARYLKDDDFTYWDRMAPLDFSGKPPPVYTWDQALETVCACFKQFDPEFEEIVRDMIANKRVDAAPKKGKTAGAYSVSCNSKIPDFVLLNFKGTQNDIKTMAHEFGHTIHTYFVKR